MAPSASITLVAKPSISPTAAICPSLIATLPLRRGLPVPSISVPFLIKISYPRMFSSNLLGLIPAESSCPGIEMEPFVLHH